MFIQSCLYFSVSLHVTTIMHSHCTCTYYIVYPLYIITIALIHNTTNYASPIHCPCIQVLWYIMHSVSVGALHMNMCELLCMSQITTCITKYSILNTSSYNAQKLLLQQPPLATPILYPLHIHTFPENCCTKRASGSPQTSSMLGSKYVYMTPQGKAMSIGGGEREGSVS